MVKQKTIKRVKQNYKTNLDEKLKNLTCDKMGIPIEMVQNIKDSRFDDIEEV